MERGSRPATRYVQDAAGAYIGYQVTGRGALDIVLAFGHNLSIQDQVDGRETMALIEELGRLGRVVRLDRRGLGVSDPAPPSTADSWEVWSDDARVVLESLGIERAVVVATDTTAANSAMLFTATHPDLVSHLVLFHPTARYLADADYPIGVTDSEAERIVTLAWKSLVNEDLRFIDPLPEEADEGYDDWWIRARRRTPPAEVRRIYSNGIRSDLRAVLPAIHVPTLVLLRPVAVQLDAAHLDRVRFVADRIPSATLVELPTPGTVLAYLGARDELVSEIAAFLTGARPATLSSRVLTTVLFTDIADSTRHVSELGDHDWRKRLDAHDTLTRELLATHGGREVNTTGDGFVATFDGPARAIACAASIQEALRAIGVQVRTGIHTGEVERRGEDIAGFTVHLAARVAAAAAPGEVLVSRTVVDLVAGAGITFSPRGAHTLKGLDGTWELHSVDATDRHRP